MTLKTFFKTIPISPEINIRLRGKSLSGLHILTGGAYQKYTYKAFTEELEQVENGYEIEEISVYDNCLEIVI